MRTAVAPFICLVCLKKMKNDQTVKCSEDTAVVAIISLV